MFDNVLVGVDGRQGGRDAIALAKRLAAPGAALALVHVYGAGPTRAPGGALLLPGELEHSQQLLEGEREAASLDAHLVTSAERSIGRGLHEAAERHSADLLVVGSCHRGLLGRVLLGDDTKSALNGSPCAVAIAPAGYAEPPVAISKIGVGYDGSPESEWALVAARELAAWEGASVKALAVVSLQSIPYGEPITNNWLEIADQLVSRERRRLVEMEDVDGDATYGAPSEELAAFSKELDLLIVGSRSYGPVGRLFNGSTSNHLARRASCPLLVLPRSSSPGAEQRDTASDANKPIALRS